ncbi:MAG TPA: serine hydrolase [Chitinophagales bacterium]|nr:serine hydrolase [Chitinophagales bacterium]
MLITTYYRFILYCFGISILCSLAACTTPARIVFFNAPSIEDVDIFSVDTVAANPQPFTFAKKSYAPLPPLKQWVKHPIVNEFYSLEEFLIRTQTTSFLVIRNDTILYENYFNGFDMDRPSIVFSVSKAITTTLVGIAIKEGHIKNLQEPVYKYIPEFANDNRRNITLEHLIQMTSGLNAADHSRLLLLARIYYNTHLEDLIKKVKLKHQPGTVFDYKSLDTAILGICLEQAIGKPISVYMQEKLWQPIGAEYNCLVTLDRENGTPRLYGGLAACARDLAKVGRLYLNNGSWNNLQILPEQWVQRSTTINLAHQEGCWWGYSTGWWLDSYVGGNLLDKQDFEAAGYNGQLIYVNPETNIIVVRQGKAESKQNWVDIAARLANLLNTCTETKDYSAKIDTAQFIGTFKSIAAPKTICKIWKKDADKSSDGEQWVVKKSNELKGVEMTQESPLSLFNDKARQRIIYDIDTKGEVIGLYFDNFHKTKYYEKIKP